MQSIIPYGLFGTFLAKRLARPDQFPAIQN